MKPVLPPELRPATDFVRAMVVLNWLVPPVVVFLAFMSFAVGGFIALAGLFSTTAALSSLPKRPHYELP